MSITIKSRHGELILTDKDIIMDNGSCFQLITQTYIDGWAECNYELSKTTCKKLIKDGQLILNNRDDKNGLDYYKLA